MAGGLVDTTEMYLRTILDLEEEGIVPLRARISERLGHSGPTVSQTIARMERDGLVTVATDRRLVLTDDGREKAVRVLRKHRLAETLLANVIGLDLAQVHDEACRWEHVMSEEAEQRIFELLGRPDETPYGTPIPGLEEFGVAAAEPFLDGVESLDAVVPKQGQGGVTVRIRRLGEPVQADIESLRVLHETGALPGATIEASADGDRIAIKIVAAVPHATGEAASGDAELAGDLQVAAAGSVGAGVAALAGGAGTAPAGGGGASARAGGASAAGGATGSAVGGAAEPGVAEHDCEGDAVELTVSREIAEHLYVVRHDA